MSAPRHDNARRGAAGKVGKANSTDLEIFAEVLDVIKSQVMTGGYVAASDFAPNQRPVFWAAIAKARDDLPNLKPGSRKRSTWTGSACASASISSSTAS